MSSPSQTSIQQALRQLPQIEKLFALPAVEAAKADASRSDILVALRCVVEGLRADILAGSINGDELAAKLRADALEARFRQELNRRLAPAYRRVINATGIILHTGLGRAVLSPAARAAFEESLRGYSIVEVDVTSGDRNHREAAAVNILKELTGAQAGTVVNNNAAATLLIVAALARGREAIVSRGELVEIGGSYRIPDVLREGGAELVEVGTTNRTYVRDYENAVTPNTGLLLQVHTSNFEIQGFSHSPMLSELAALGRERGLPVACDLGSGCFVDLSAYGFRAEPLVADKISDGADLVCFSGDKLLGGPQAGIILGKEKYVKRLRSHSLFRALRVDKATLVALEATLRAYRDPETLSEKIPTLQLIMNPADKIQQRAKLCCDNVAQRAPELGVAVVSSSAQAGSGALPTQEIPSFALALTHPKLSADELALLLRVGTPSVFARIRNNQVQLDFRTVLPDDERELVEALVQLTN